MLQHFISPFHYIFSVLDSSEIQLWCCKLPQYLLVFPHIGSKFDSGRDERGDV